MDIQDQEFESNKDNVNNAITNDFSSSLRETQSFKVSLNFFSKQMDVNMSYN